VELDQLSVVLRQRNPWEAIDLGFAMVREWWRDVYGAWLVVYVPLAVAACLLLPPLWAFLLVWWLKPALDRIVLHVVASAVFGSRPRLRATLRSYFSYAANGLVLSLLPLPFFRFSLSRSLGLPVRQLESARGREARLRIQQLRKRVSSHAMWFTFICMNFEAVVFFSLAGLFDMLIPAARQESFDPFELFQLTASSSRAYLGTAVYLAAIALVEPLYVAGGFALYLNRRTTLEGWDLEVQLRRIAQRARQPDIQQTPEPTPVVTALVALGLGLTLLLAMPGSGSAQDAANPPLSDPPVPEQMRVPETPLPQAVPEPPRSRAAQEVKEVLKRPEFQTHETHTLLVPLHESENEPDKTTDRWRGFGDGAFLQFVAEMLRGLAWVLLGGVLLFALYWVLRQLNWIRGTPDAQWAPPGTLFGLDVRPESLPDDVAAAALELARAGKLVEALSLLYRGALVTLLYRDHIELTSGDTETECLRKAHARVAAPTHDYLARLLGTWQRAAYAHRIPAPPEVERLASEWPGYFRPDA
jgi:hypothetical protein